MRTPGPPMAIVREIEWGGPEFASFLGLRQEYLRAPLGLDLYDEDLDAERDYRHFGLFDGDTLIGGAVVVPRGDASAQIRQMIILPQYRRRGLGAKIVGTIAQVMRENSVTLLFLHARADAVEFYRSCGFQSVGDEFPHVTIPHRRMEKAL